MTAMRLHRLGDLCEITPSPSSDLFADLAEAVDGTPVVTPADIATGRIAERSRLRVLPRVPDSLGRFKLSPDDLVVVRQGAVGRVAVAGESCRGWIYHSSCMRLRPDAEAVDPAYLMAYLSHPPVVDQLLARTHVGTVATITAAVLADLPVALPTLAEQRLIARALGEVDLQMDIQRRLLSRLEALRPALFSRMLGGEVPGERSGKPADITGERRPNRMRRMNRMS